MQKNSRSFVHWIGGEVAVAMAGHKKLVLINSLHFIWFGRCCWTNEFEAWRLFYFTAFNASPNVHANDTPCHPHWKPHPVAALLLLSGKSTKTRQQRFVIFWLVLAAFNCKNTRPHVTRPGQAPNRRRRRDDQGKSNGRAVSIGRSPEDIQGTRPLGLLDALCFDKMSLWPNGAKYLCIHCLWIDFRHDFPKWTIPCVSPTAGIQTRRGYEKPQGPFFCRLLCCSQHLPPSALS